MKKILTGFIWDGKSGGIDRYLMSFARVSSAQGVKLHFLTNEYSAELAERLAFMGHSLYEIATLREKRKQRELIYKLHDENHYDAAYFNISTALMYPVVKNAKKAGIPQVIVHAHAAGNDQPTKLKQMIFDYAHICSRKLLRRSTSDYVACSKAAGAWLFGNKALNSGKVSIVSNPVDLDACAFDEETRLRVRSSLGIGEELVVGSVTAFKMIKNPFFLIDVFIHFKTKCPASVLVVVGGGELEDEVRSYAQENLEEGSYHILGKMPQAYEYYQAFDAFVLPSIREGFSIASLEAQAAGLPCLLSEGIPEDVFALHELCSRISLAEGPDAWGRKLFDLTQTKSKEHRGKAAGRMKDMGYSLESSQAILEMLK